MTTEDFDALLAEIAELKARLARCVELPHIPVGCSLSIDNLTLEDDEDQVFRAVLCDEAAEPLYSSPEFPECRTPAAALAALKESMDAK